MRPYSEYTNTPEGFKFEYVKRVMKVLYPITFAISVLMVAVSLATIGIAYLEIVKGSRFSKWHLDVLDSGTKLKIGIFMLIISVAYSRWYIVVFFPDGILNMVL